MDYYEIIYGFTQLKRNIIIDDRDDSLIDNTDANALWPGYFGNNYSNSKILIVGHYPAGGTSSYEIPTTADREFYDSIIKFKNSTIETRNILFNKMNDIGRIYIPRWSIYSVINVLLKKVNMNLDDVIYFNVLPFRIPNNRTPRVLEKDRAWQFYTKKMIELFSPNVIVCLGMATGKIVNMKYKGKGKVFTLRRRIGDKSIDPDVYIECDAIEKYIKNII
jgi:hypothetical protein